MEINTELLIRAFSKEPAIVLIGQSGCGKQTQSDILVALHKELFPDREVYVSCTGEIYRETIPTLSDYCRKKLAETQSAGKLQAWSPTVAVWGRKFLQNYNGGLIIIDGSPRSVGEAEALHNFYFDWLGKEVIVFLLHIDDKEADRRMCVRNDDDIKKGKKARSDSDTPEKRKEKLAYFQRDVIPALEYLELAQGSKVWTIDGMQEKPAVTKQILSILTAYYVQ